jgi:hypothetical protein
MAGRRCADAEVVSVIQQAAHAFITFMDGGPPPAWILVSFYLLTMPFLLLLHELGHAAAALALRPGGVAVGIGREPHLFHIVLGRLMVAFHPWVGFWRAHGVCMYQRPESRTEDAIIAAAGPAASLLACIVTRTMLVNVSPGLLHDALAVMTLYLLSTGVVSLVPRSFDRHGTRMRSDGGLIVDALLQRNALANEARRT